jgi:hypothetical protein
VEKEWVSGSLTDFFSTAIFQGGRMQGCVWRKNLFAGACSPEGDAEFRGRQEGGHWSGVESAHGISSLKGGK